MTLIEQLAEPDETAGLTGILGVAARLTDRIGEWGVGLFAFLDILFPLVPSEVILPLAGFLAQQGTMEIGLLIVTSTLGTLAGSLLLYWVGAVMGLDRAIPWLSKLPLVDATDFQRAADWFHRHGRFAIFFGRLIPGVRSLISLPAGAEKMNLWVFTAFTIAGGVIWNSLLIGLGAALGTQYELVSRYSGFLNYVVLAWFGVLLVLLVMRRLRRSRPGGLNSGTR